MFTRKINLPMRYLPGTVLSTTGVLFYQDGGCIQLGRELTIVPNLYKEKLIALDKDRVTEWVIFHFDKITYVTSMKVYTALKDYNNHDLVTCDKYLFTKAIESVLQDTKMCQNAGLESAQLFRLKNAIIADPQFESDEEEIFFNLDRIAYLDNKLEKLLLTENEYPLIPVATDLIFKKEIGSEILEEPDDYYLDGPCPISTAVSDLTVPILSYLAGATPLEKSIITQLSPFQYHPKLIQMIGSHVNEDITRMYQYRCPFDKSEVSKALHLEEFLYHAIDAIDRDGMDTFSLKYSPIENQFETIYCGNTYFKDYTNHISMNLRLAFVDLCKWYNNRIKSIHVCKTISEEIFIDIEIPSGLHEKFYLDITIFDLMAHNLI